MRVLVVDVDSLRPDHLGAYGYARDTSPTVDALAARGLRFDRCYVSDSPCLPSRTALATCRHGVKSGVVTHWGAGQFYDHPGNGHDAGGSRITSFRQLWEHGVRTATVSSFSANHLASHFAGSFQEAIQASPRTGGLDDGADVVREAESWLDRHAAADDWLLHVNFWDVHHPYRDVDEAVERVRESGPGPAWPDEETIEAHGAATGSRTASLWPIPNEYGTDEFEDGYWRVEDYWPMPVSVDDRADLDGIVDAYDASIRKVDAWVGRLLGALEDAGVREETAVVVTADHGEAFGEQGIYADHAMAHRASQRVPLVVDWPGGPEGRVVDEFVHQFDLMPTLCEAAGVPVPEGWDAESFAPLLADEPFEGREYLVAGHGNYVYSRAVYTDRFAYTRLIHPGVYSLPGEYNDPDLPGGGLELLFDLEADPRENVVDDHPDVASRLSDRLDAWVAERVATGDRDAGGTDPLVETAARDGPFCYVDPEGLRALAADHGVTFDERGEAAIDRARTFPPAVRGDGTE
jgi:arylsulfatase A-like enzyme